MNRDLSGEFSKWLLDPLVFVTDEARVFCGLTAGDSILNASTGFGVKKNARWQNEDETA